MVQASVVTFGSATPGQEVATGNLVLTQETVERYLEAIEASSAVLGAEPGRAPPMALAAASFRLLIESVSLPSGTMHLAQQLRFLAPALVGVPLRPRARVAQKLARGAGTAIALEHSVLTEEGNVCLSGRALLLVPSEPASPLSPLAGGVQVEGRDTGDPAAGGLLHDGDRVRPPLPGGHGDPAAAARLGGPGDGLMPVVREITTEKIRRYARASGDFNPVHLDETFARGTPFGGIVAHGMLLLAYVAEVMERAFGSGWRQGGGMDVRLRAAARPGDVVESAGVWQQTRAAPEGTIAECKVACLSQRGETLVAGRAWARLT